MRALKLIYLFLGLRLQVRERIQRTWGPKPCIAVAYFTPCYPPHLPGGLFFFFFTSLYGLTITGYNPTRFQSCTVSDHLKPFCRELWAMRDEIRANGGYLKLVHRRRKFNTRADRYATLATMPGHGQPLPADLIARMPPRLHPYSNAPGQGVDPGLPPPLPEGREPSLCGVNTQGRPGSNLHSSEDRLAGSTDSKGTILCTEKGGSYGQLFTVTR